MNKYCTRKLSICNFLQYMVPWVSRGAYRVLVGKPEGRSPLGRPRRRWVDNIRKDLQELGCGYMDWIGLAQDRESWRTFVSAVMNLRVPWNAGNFLTSCKPVSFSRRTLHHGVSIWFPNNLHYLLVSNGTPKSPLGSYIQYFTRTYLQNLVRMPSIWYSDG